MSLPDAPDPDARAPDSLVPASPAPAARDSAARAPNARVPDSRDADSLAPHSRNPAPRDPASGAPDAPNPEALLRLAAIGRQAGEVAHDVRNLLGVVLAAAGQVRPAAADAEAAEALDVLREAAGRAAALLQRLLAGEAIPAPRTIPLAATLAQAAPLIRQALGPGIALALPPGADGLVRADPAELGRVWLNLARNAARAMGGAGTLTIGITRATRPSPGGGERRLLCVSVHDTGPGFPAAMRGRLGRPFATTSGGPDSPGGTDGTGGAGAASGTGLGLSSVASILALVGGSLELAETPDQAASPDQAGSSDQTDTSDQAAPSDEAAAPDQATAPDQAAPSNQAAPSHRAGRPDQAAPPSQPAPTGQGARLLVLLPEQADPPPVTGTGPLALLVEDEPSLARLAARSLTGAGWRVLGAECAESALDRLAAGDAPQLVVTDLALPGLDGLALLSRLRERWPDLPAILTSGYGVPPAGLAPRTAFLAKPYALRDLLALARSQAG